MFFGGIFHWTNYILVNLHVSTCSTLSFVNYNNSIFDKGLENPDILQYSEKVTYLNII